MHHPYPVRLLALVTLLAALPMFGCATSDRFQYRLLAEPPPTLVGLWWNRESGFWWKTQSTGGIVLSCEGPVAADDTKALLHAMATAPIIDRFRSERESWGTFIQCVGQRQRPFLWLYVSFDEAKGQWTASEQSPPLRKAYPLYGINDELPIPASLPEPDGPMYTVHLLPPPLEARGVAVLDPAMRLHRSLHAIWPRDLTIYLTTDWTELERLRPPHPPELWRFESGDYRQLPWSSLQTIRSAPQPDLQPAPSPPAAKSAR